MKFNFEDAKSVLKKVAIGAGIVATSVSPLEAIGKGATLLINDKIKETNKESKESINEEKKDNKNVSFEDAKKLSSEVDLRKNKEKDRIAELRQELGAIYPSEKAKTEEEYHKVDGVIPLNESKNIDPEYHRSEYLKYMNDPAYKDRLAKEMYGDDILDETKQSAIDLEYKYRLDNIKNVQINMNKKIQDESEDPSSYNPYEKTISTTPRASLHELTHATAHRDDAGIQKGFIDIKNKYIPDQSSVYVNYIKGNETKIANLNDISLAKIVKEYIINNKDNIKFKVNDMTISSNGCKNAYDFVLKQTNDTKNGLDLFQFHEYLSSEDQEKIYSNNKELLENMKEYSQKFNKIYSKFNYYSKNSEIKARLDFLRLRAVKEYNFDQKNDFDINKFLDIKNDRQYKELKEKLDLTDDQINELMKYTAENVPTENIDSNDKEKYA